MIPQSFDEAYERVKHLVSIFRQNEKRYLSSAYPEAQARLDFIDKFWIALGWDVNHEMQTNPYEQEVKVERGVAMSAGRKRADYAFLASNFRDVLFYVEAKKPQGDLDTLDNYFQTIRYGWSNQTPLAVLTDFEHLRILDCRYRPDIETSINRAVKKFHYSEYADKEKFREIYYLFSRESATKGSLEKYSASLPKPKRKADQRTVLGGGIQSIDELFLQELDGYREELARSFKNKNPHLNSEELTEVTQRTLDRLVFMRFLEDKLIEPEPLVKNLGGNGTAWQDFVATSHRLDGIYNGIIFKKHTLLDAPDFQVDERTFTGIRDKFAHTNSPYDFNAIPIHILGSIYERFLGKVIVATDKRARVEEKPEVRKAGGVYYTPQYIVTYIVENTVGKLIEGKTPDEVSKLRFADIACGSGSFLLGVYDLLLRHHAAYYNEKKNQSKAIRAGCVKRDDGALHLSLRQKKDILLNNIYGVDLDGQAVEVAQLSLFLKLLEDETTASAKGHQLEFRETMLPSLDKNVIHGNSLIERDIQDGQLFEDDDERKLYPLDFVRVFPKVMQSGGFDAVVGNPPWGAAFTEVELSYFRKKYHRVIARMVDSYLYFLDRATQLVTRDGIVGFIIPSTLLNQVDAKPMRQLLLSRGLTTLVSLGSKIFGHKVLNTSTILISQTRADGPLALHNLSRFREAAREKGLSNHATTTWKAWKELVSQDSHLTFFMNDQNATSLLMRLREKHESLGDLIPTGIQRGVTPDTAGAHVISRLMAKKACLETELLRPSVSGVQIKRYEVWESDQFIIYTKRDTTIKKFPCVAEYLEGFRHLNSCPEVKQGKHPWWALHRPRDPEIFASPKIIGLTTTKTIQLIFDPNQSIFVTDAMYVFRPPKNWDPWTLIAIMQSKLFLFLYRTANQGESRIIPQVKASKLETLPIPFCNSTDELSNRLNKFAAQMLDSKKHLRTARTDSDINYYEHKCADIDRQIDALVYKLYDLTNEEIAIIEAA